MRSLQKAENWEQVKNLYFKKSDLANIQSSSDAKILIDLFKEKLGFKQETSVISLFISTALSKSLSIVKKGESKGSYSNHVSLSVCNTHIKSIITMTYFDSKNDKDEQIKPYYLAQDLLETGYKFFNDIDKENLTLENLIKKINSWNLSV